MKRLYILAVIIAGVFLISIFTVSCDVPLLSLKTTVASTTQPQTDITTLGDNGEVPTQGQTVDWEATEESIAASKEAQIAVELDAEKKILSRKNNRKPYDELITKTVDIYGFMEKYNASPLLPEKFPSLRELDEDIGIECIRKSKAGNYYSVHKLEQGGLLYIFYIVIREDYGYLAMHSWFASQKSLSYSDFDSIRKGSVYEDVEKIDSLVAFYKKRAYDFDYIYTNDPQPLDNFYSQHYLTDGIITIDYWYEDGNWIVKRIYREGFKVFHINAGSNPEYDGQILKIDAIQ